MPSTSISNPTTQDSSSTTDMTTDQLVSSSLAANPAVTISSTTCIDTAVNTTMAVAFTPSEHSEDNSSDFESDDDLEITHVTVKNCTNRLESFGPLNKNEYDIILSLSGWLDCKIIQEAHICLKKVNPLIEGFQITTHGPARNFDIMSSEFVQILHTGMSHWVCVSSINCQRGYVNLYDSLYHDIIEKEVEQQVKDLLSDSYLGITNVSVTLVYLPLPFEHALFIPLTHKKSCLTFHE